MNPFASLVDPLLALEMSELVRGALPASIRHVDVGTQKNKAKPGIATFGGRLREARIAAGLTQLQLGKAVYEQKYGTEQVIDLESNKALPSYKTILRLCKTLKVSPNYLFGVSE